MSTAKVSSKGQVVIPKPLREKLGLRSGSRLKVTLENHRVILTPFTEPPPEILVEASGDSVSRHLGSLRREDEMKVEALLRALGVGS